MKFLRTHNILFVIAAGGMFFIQSCVVHKLKVNRPEGTFHGLRSIIEEEDDVSIFITHGMGISDVDFEDPLIRSTIDALGYEAADTTYHRHNKALVKVLTFTKEDKTMKFYVHGWFFATSPKWVLVWTDRNTDRLETMDNIKYSLMNQSISDVIMYQGNFRDLIKKDMEWTLQLMVQENPEAAFVGISESLGSKIFIETMNDNLDNNSDWAVKWYANLNSIFMLSNQLPLLYLGDLDVEEQWLYTLEPDKMRENTTQAQKAMQEAYAPLRKFTEYGERSDTKTQLVAISDPNDLLSYPVPKGAVYSENFELTNVTVSVAVKGYSFPFGKPKIVNPVDAHLNYQTNEHVINYVVNGNPE